MAITVKHSKNSTVADAGDATLVQPSDWNADHTLTGTVPVANGGTGAATLTGYVKGNGTSAMTAASTIPSTDVTGLGTMSTQNATAIAVTGGTMSGVTISDYVATATKGVANGVASLDGSGTVPISQLPSAVLGALNYQGTWNASTNTPTLTSSVGTKGYYYVVSVAGSTNLNGITDWVVGDWAVYNGSVWQKVDNTDAVTSVNGKTGTVVLTNTDISGFGTMSTQNANAVAITGGAIDGTPIGATTPSTAALTYGSTNNTTSTTPALSYNASNASFVNGATVAGSYLQNVMQNKSASAGASTNFAVSNNLGTDSSYYGEMGMNSSVYSSGTPIDFFSLNNGIYYSGHDGDVTYGSGNGYKTYLAWGTTGQSAHVINATGAIGLNTNITGTTNFGTSGQVLTSAGSGATPTWATPTTGTVTSVSGTTGRITSTGGNTPVIDLASGVATAGTTGSSTLIPVVTIDTYGRVTSITTASNPQGTVTSVTGTAPVVSSGGATPAISMPAATTSVSGYLTSTDWTTFNNKGSGTVTSVTATSPVTSSGGTTPVIAMPAATTSVSGYLTSTDWTTFNNKGSGTVTSVAAITLGTTGTDLSSTVATGTTTPVITLQVPTASASNRGALSSTDWSTFNGKAPAVTYTSTYVPYGQGTTTPALSSSFTYDGTLKTLTAPQVSASNGLVVNSNTVAASYSIPSGSSAMSVGPMTVASGQSVTVPSGSRWVVL
jgi:hypothetical protein